jgi:hypothetical protein
MRSTLALAFKVVALAMAVLTIVFVALEEGEAGLYAIYLAIGLATMAIGSIMDHGGSSPRNEIEAKRGAAGD